MACPSVILVGSPRSKRNLLVSPASSAAAASAALGASHPARPGLLETLRCSSPTQMGQEIKILINHVQLRTFKSYYLTSILH